MMKLTLSVFFLFSFSKGYSQVSLKVKQIDTLVSTINNSTLPVHKDTLRQDHPEMGLNITTYLSMTVSGKELLKFVNYVITTRTEDGIAQQMTASNTFYYDHNNLIKVEEYLIQDAIKKEANWYYADGKPLYYTLQSDKAESRAALLHTMSKSMLKQIIK